MMYQPSSKGKRESAQKSGHAHTSSSPQNCLHSRDERVAGEVTRASRVAGEETAPRSVLEGSLVPSQTARRACPVVD